MTNFANDDSNLPLIRPRENLDNVPIVRSIERLHSHSDFAPIAGLLEILSWKRPYDSATEEHFARHYLDVIAGCERDSFGNRHIKVPLADGSPSRILWSSHIDTCHHDEGYQRLAVKEDEDEILYVCVQNIREGNCLGADDGTGVWMMLEMIKAGKPGYYLFHRGEERGCMGSKWIVENTPTIFGEIDAAIALDRRDFSNVITHQGSERGCSEAFAEYIASHLPNYKPDPTGMYTDTKQYFRLIPECTNLSVGYQNQHGPLERQYLGFAASLLEHLIELPVEDAPIKRNPTHTEYKRYDNGYSNWRGSNSVGVTTYVWCRLRLEMVEKGKEIACAWDSTKKLFVPEDPAEADRILDAEKIAKDAKKAGAASEDELPFGDDDEGLATFPDTSNLPPNMTKALLTDVLEDCDLTLMELVRKYPGAVVKMLGHWGLGEEDMLLEVYGEGYEEFILRHCIQ